MIWTINAPTSMNISDINNLRRILDDTQYEEETMRPSLHLLKTQSDRYTPHSIIGSGSLKQVSKCYDHRSQRFIAMAELLPEHRHSQYDELFIQEAWLTSTLNHPNIIKVHDVGLSQEQTPFFTMDLRSNLTLHSLVAQSPPLSGLVDVYLKVLDAIAYAHQQGVLHLDLKPENIQCDAFGQVLVCDWGLAKFCHHETESGDIREFTEHLSQRNTLHGVIKGTPGFMAREQIIPHEEKDARTDIFALGAILYYLLFQCAPFEGDSVQVIQATQDGTIRHSPKTTGQRASLFAIAMKALQPDPEHRYQSVSDLRQDIVRTLSGFPPLAESPSLVKKTHLFLQRHQWKCIVTLTILTISAFFLIIVQQIIATKNSEVNSLSDSFSSYRDATNAEREQFARSIRAEGINAKHEIFVGKFSRQHFNHDIVAGFNRSLILLDASLNLFKIPNDSDTPAHWVGTNFYTLNFHNILTRKRLTSHAQSSHIYDYAKSFPYFRHNYRPSIKNLDAFFLKVLSDKRIAPEQLEAIYRYDWSSRTDHTQYLPITISLIKKLNQPHDSIRVHLSADQSTLTLSTEAPKTHFKSKISDKYFGPLAYLEIEHLVIDSPNATFDLADLDGALATTIDLSQTRTLLCSAPFHAEPLQTLMINPHQLPQVQSLLKQNSSSKHQYLFELKSTSKE